MIFEFLFGWIFELLPMSMSATARRRAWRRGKRVVLRARVPQDLRVDHVALVEGDLWLIRNLGFEAESITKIDWSKTMSIRLPSRRFARPDDTVEIELDGRTVSIIFPLDWDLLREAALGWQTKVAAS